LLLRALGPAPDVPALTDKAEVDRTFKDMRLRTIVALTFGYGMAYTCRLGMSVVKKPLIDGGIYSATELGWIGAAWKISYGFGKLFNGFLVDHASVRKLIPIGLGASAIVNLAMGSNTLIFVAVALWALNGWFQGFLAPGSVACLTQWFSGKERGTYYGIWSAAHSLGEGVTFFGTAILVGMTSWRVAFWLPGFLVLFVAVAMYFALRERPGTVGLPTVQDWQRSRGERVDESDDDESTDARRKAAQSQLSIQLALLKNPAIWICGIASACMYVTRYAVNEWGMLYFQEEHQLGRALSGTLLTLNTIGGIAGSFAYGWISDRFFGARRPPVTLMFGILEVVSLFLIFFAPNGNAFVIGAGMVLYGFTLSGILAVLGGLFAVDMEPRAAGFAMGVVGCFSYIGAAGQDIVSGILIERGTTVVDGVRHYDFTAPVFLWIGASILSMLLAASLWRVQTRD
jgi:OPA family sugar phosphate sensor protein UhpC-like MFS transporter